MPREPLYLKVEIDGETVRRRAEPLRLYDRTGKIIATYMRPTIFYGERLVERADTFPQTIREIA